VNKRKTLKAVELQWQCFSNIKHIQKTKQIFLIFIYVKILSCGEKLLTIRSTTWIAVTVQNRAYLLDVVEKCGVF